MFNPTWAHVGVVYAAAIALARRGGVEIPRRVALFFYLLVLVFLYLPLTQDYVDLPVDFLKTLPPWTYVAKDHDAVNTQTNDIVLQIVPWAHQVRQSWRSLEAPLWNHLSAGGYPLLASGQSSALSPLRLVALPLSLGHAMTAEAALKILIALTFTFLYCRRRGFSELASTIAAVAFGFSTFIIVWLHFPLISTACFVPAVFYLIDLLAERWTYPRFVCAAAVWAVMLFGGHPETVSHTFFLAFLYVLWIIVIERRASWRFLITLGGAMAVAGLLAMPFLAPFAEAVTRSKRFQELEANPNEPVVPYADWESAKLLVLPHYFGAVPKEEARGPAHAEAITGFAGILGVAAWFALLSHVVATRAWRPREMFFLLATVLLLGVILAWPGISDAFHLVFSLAANARLRLLFAFVLAIQTAAAIDLATRDRRSLLMGIACAAVILGYLIFDANDYRDAVLTSAIPSIIVLVLAACSVFRVPRFAFFQLLLLVAVIAELWNVTRDWNPDVPDALMYPKTPLLEKLDEIRATLPANEPFRIVGNGPMLFPNLSAIYGYEDVRAHDPMTNGRYVGLLRHIVNYDSANYFAPWPDVTSGMLNFLNVRVRLTTPGQLNDPRWALRYQGADGNIFENTELLPRFFPARNVLLVPGDDDFARRLKEMNDKWSHTALLDHLDLESPQMRDDFFQARPADAPIATSRILDAAPTEYRLHVRAPRYTLMVSSVPWWPGWKVERNGARVDPIRVNGGFLGFAVPPGELDVRVWYDPWSFRLGAIIALATIAALIAFAVRQRTGASQIVD